MISRVARSVLVLAVVLGAGQALAEGGMGFDLTVHGGVDKYDSVGFKSGLSKTDFTDAQQRRVAVVRRHGDPSPRDARRGRPRGAGAPRP